MASTARIDELKKKFDENPRRYFAPLANEFRKAGDIEQAIIICEEFLPQQPGHMSGHIVYGQALYEAGRMDEARTVFETALALDPENLIALRHLGDIARSQGDPESARTWYMRVLDADPRNDEIQGLIASLNAVEAPSISDFAPPAAPAEQLAADTVKIPSMARTVEVEIEKEVAPFESLDDALRDTQPAGIPIIASGPMSATPPAGVPLADEFTLDGFEGTH